MEQRNDPGSEPVYVISVAARLAGLPCWVLRVLDQEEIVVPVRTDSNRRLYSDHDITLLARVRHLTEERGVNIAGVKVILEIEKAFEAERSGFSAAGASNGTSASSALIPAPVTLPAFRTEANTTAAAGTVAGGS